jgi:hypothetical protein
LRRQGLGSEKLIVKNQGKVHQRQHDETRAPGDPHGQVVTPFDDEDRQAPVSLSVPCRMEGAMTDFALSLM